MGTKAKMRGRMAELQHALESHARLLEAEALLKGGAGFEAYGLILLDQRSRIVHTTPMAERLAFLETKG